MADDNEQKYLWPDVPRTAFQEGDHPPYASNVGYAVQRGSYRGYAVGYADAAKAVFEGISRPGLSIDLVLLPLGFLWRQCFELYLKEIIWRAQEVQMKGSGTLPWHHSLHELWATAKPLIAPLGEPNSRVLANVSSVIDELRAIDGTAQGFRYPIVERGKGKAKVKERALLGVPEIVNVRAFHEAMMAVANFFDIVILTVTEEHGRRLEEAGD